MEATVRPSGRDSSPKDIKIQPVTAILAGDIFAVPDGNAASLSAGDGGELRTFSESTFGGAVLSSFRSFCRTREHVRVAGSRALAAPYHSTHNACRRAYRDRRRRARAALVFTLVFDPRAPRDRGLGPSRCRPRAGLQSGSFAGDGRLLVPGGGAGLGARAGGRRGGHVSAATDQPACMGMLQALRRPTRELPRPERDGVGRNDPSSGVAAAQTARRVGGTRGGTGSGGLSHMARARALDRDLPSHGVLVRGGPGHRQRSGLVALDPRRRDNRHRSRVVEIHPLAGHAGVAARGLAPLSRACWNAPVGMASLGGPGSAGECCGGAGRSLEPTRILESGDMVHRMEQVQPR